MTYLSRWQALSTKFLWMLFLLSLPFQLGRHFWFPFSYVNGLRVDYLPPTIYLQDIIFLIILGVFLLQKKQNILKSIVSTPKTLSVLLVLYVLSNIFFSLSPWLTVYSFLRLFQFILVVYLVGRENKQILNALKTVLPISAISQLAISITQVATSHSVGGLLYWLGERSFNLATPDIAKAFLFNHVWLRPYGTFSHPNSLAGFMLLVFILSWVFLSGRIKWLTLITSFLVVLFSFSQSAWLALFLIVSYLFISRYNISPRRKIISIIFSISLISSLIYLYRGYIIDSPSFVLRLSLLQASWSIFLSHPLFGVGLGNFIVALGQQNDFTRLIHWYQPVHNIFVLWIVETGMVGLSILFYAIYKIFNGNKNYHDIFIKQSLISLFLILIVTGSLDHYWLTLIQNRLLLAVVLGLLFSRYDMNGVKTAESRH